MKKIIAIGAVLILMALMVLVGCDGGSLPGGPAIESISAQVETGEAEETTETTEEGMETTTEEGGETTAAADEDSQLIPDVVEDGMATTTAGETTAAAGEGVSVSVDVTVANFEIVTEVGETEGDGYLVYYMDQLPAGLSEIPGIETTPTMDQIPQTAMSESTDTSYTFENVGPGVHVFSVQLVDTNGDPLVPPVIAAVIITVPQSITETTTEAMEETTTTSEESPLS